MLPLNTAKAVASRLPFWPSETLRHVPAMKCSDHQGMSRNGYVLSYR